MLLHITVGEIVGLSACYRRESKAINENITMTTPVKEAKVAVLVDCDNTDPAVLAYVLRVAAQFGRVVVRRGYGNHTTLSNMWANRTGGICLHSLPPVSIRHAGKIPPTLPWRSTRWK